MKISAFCSVNNAKEKLLTGIKSTIKRLKRLRLKSRKPSPILKKKSAEANKTTIILMVVLISFFAMLSPLYTFCASDTDTDLGGDLTTAVIEELDEIDFSGFSEILEELEENNTNIFSITNIKSKVYSIISGENAVSYSSVIASLLSIFLDLVLKYLPCLSLIIAIAVVSNLLSGIRGKFNEKSTGNLVHLVCFLSVVILMIGMIANLSTLTSQSLSSMVGQMNVLFPILLTLMIAIGASSTASIFQPTVAILSTYVADIFTYIVLPLFMASFVFGIISNLSSNIRLDKFNSFLSSLFKWFVGIVFSLFFAILTIQGITAGAFDSLSIRTTKYTVKSYVPIIGSYLSEGMDLIMASTILIKNSVGLVGVLLVINTILSPLLEIVVFSLLLKLVSAVIQPMGQSRTSNFLMSTSKSLTMLSTVIIAVGFMYLVSIGLIMTTTNMVV